MNKAAASCKKHSKPRREPEKVAKPSPTTVYVPRSNCCPIEVCDLSCCGDTASTASSSNQSDCCDFSVCGSRVPVDESYQSDPRRRHSTPVEDDYPSDSRYSSSKYNPSSLDDPKGEPFVSTQVVYITIFLFVLGMLLLILKVLLTDNTDSCHICDETVLPAELHRVEKLESLKKYVVDYASEEHGACVESHDTYHYIKRGSFAATDLLRLPSVDSVSPDTILKENDECFAMQGHTGTFLIRLARPIVVDAVTLVHNKAECDAAPRDFKIFGVHAQKDEPQVNLGGFRYENRGRSAQKFVVPKFHEFAYVGLNIMTNWGNRDYTCIYKIKVHGEPEH